MSIVKEDLLTVKGEKYITLEVLEYETNYYALVNKLNKNEENTDEYYIFKVLNDEIRFVVDQELIDTLMPKFEEMLNEDIKNLAEN